MPGFARAQAKAIDAKGQGLAWPNMAQLGDPIRGMIVCGSGQHKQPKQVWDTIRENFKVQVCKVNWPATNRPPDMWVVFSRAPHAIITRVARRLRRLIEHGCG